MLTDISSEMIASILPVYLVLHLGMSPLMFGFVDGIYQGAAVVVRIVAGVLSDRWRRHKEIAAFGYGISAVCRLLILAVGNAWGGIATVVALDRVGKGVRTAPRDALISASSRSADLSRAFGVHRALDATGAMLGPAMAFGVLALMPGKFDILFVTSFGIAVVGFGVILLFVPAQGTTAHQLRATRSSMKTAIGLLAEPTFRAQVLVSAILGISTISDSFIFLILQKRLDLPATAFPLLYVGTSLSTAVFAAPFGRLADRFGRARVLIGGYASLMVVYSTLFLPLSHGITLLTLSVLFFGIYYAATDGVLTAMAASVLPSEHTGSGLAVIATTTNLARMVGSILFGLLWYHLGISPATVSFMVALIVSMVVAYIMLGNARTHAVGISLT